MSEQVEEKTLGKDLKLPAGQSLEDFLKSLKEARITNLREGDKGIDNKDRLFAKMRNNRAWKKAMAGVGIGLAVGAVVQEVAAFATHQEGLVEGWLQGRKGEIRRHRILGIDFYPVLLIVWLNAKILMDFDAPNDK